MHTDYDLRHATHPEDVKSYDTGRLRREFLVERIFEKDKIMLTYSACDRFILGGVMPVKKDLLLETIDPLKAVHFCDRRELGIINIGGPGTVKVDGTSYELGPKEAVYIGKGAKDIILSSKRSPEPARFYLNSTPAHKQYPNKKIPGSQAKILHLGSTDYANERQIIQFIVEETVETCQLQMGITELKKGSIWNTMPPHTHYRRTEVYFYSALPEGQAVCHYMGEPQETRHIWVANDQAVISPPWSIHAGAGTANYFFIWGMAGENMDFTDMDPAAIAGL